jgi:hypothetical protein
MIFIGSRRSDKLTKPLIIIECNSVGTRVNTYRVIIRSSNLQCSAKLNPARTFFR